MVSPADFVAPQVEAPSDYCVDWFHTPVLMEYWFSLACLQCFYSNVAYSPRNTTQNNKEPETRLPKRVIVGQILETNKNEYTQYKHEISPAVNCKWEIMVK